MNSLNQFLYQDEANGYVIEPIRKWQGQAGPLLLIMKFRQHVLK